MHLDGRRQPQQVPRLIFGHIPAGDVDGAANGDQALPLTDVVGSEIGADLDQWTNPPVDVAPE